jgi:peptidoglycan/xylan/chitin deacetylase (PgdA/CDA1 family)
MILKNFLNIIVIVLLLIVLVLSQKNQHNKKGKASISSPGAISSFSPGGQYVMLTFDDGPHPDITPKILDILKSKRIRATFFVLGMKVADNQQILSRMIEEGHEVAAHGWNHNAITKISHPHLINNLNQTKNAIYTATKRVPVVYRPPFGLSNAEINTYITKEQKMKVILWSIDSKDYEITDPSIIANNIIESTDPGDVILCHDVHQHTIQAVQLIVDGLTKADYEFLTLSQVLSYPDDKPH